MLLCTFTFSFLRCRPPFVCSTSVTYHFDNLSVQAHGDANLKANTGQTRPNSLVEGQNPLVLDELLNAMDRVTILGSFESLHAGFHCRVPAGKDVAEKGNNAYGEKVITLSVKIMVCDRFGYRID